MAKKKVAGTERPYTFQEFAWLIESMAKEEGVPYLDQLDYTCVGLNDKKEIVNPCVDLVLRVAYGSCEGIYADIFLRTEDKEEDFLTCKTLGESDEDFVSISAMAARLCRIGSRYIDKHRDEFTWLNNNVSFYKGEKSMGGYCMVTDAKVDEYAQWGYDRGYRVVVRNNETREERVWQPKK